jgi:hypothetical protein
VKILGLLAIALPLCAQVSVTRERDAVRIDVNGQPFTSFVYGPDVRKPYFAELRSASGVRVTRGVPADASASESADHPHQKGLYFAHCDVGGYNFWATEPSQVVATTGTTVVRSVSTIRNGFTAEMELLDPAGLPIVAQWVTVTAGVDGQMRYLDFDAVLRGIRSSTFKDSTEGIFAMRVASWMEQSKSGRMRCPSGEGEQNCWGRRAPWVDFSGAHNGETLGVAVLQHPSSLRFPTYWHVRAYGLLAANPFGAQHFFDERLKKYQEQGKRPESGDFQLAPGQEARFRYRVVAHPGTPDVAELFKKYAAPELVIDKAPVVGAIAFNDMGALYGATGRGIAQVFGPGASDVFAPGAATALAFEANGDLLAVRADGLARISQTGEVKPVEAKCDGRPVAVAISELGRWIATPTAICNPRGKVLTGIGGVRAMTISGDRLLAGDESGNVWQIVPGEPRRLARVGGPVSGIAADVAGTAYVAWGSEIVEVSRLGAIVNRTATAAPVTGVAFGVADRRSLWIADAAGRIYRMPAAQRGEAPVWTVPKRLRIVSPVDGDILNRHDGAAVPGGLKITVRGEVDGDNPVTVNGVKTEVKDGRWSAEVVLTKAETKIEAVRGGLRDEALLLWDAGSFPRYRMSVDDNIQWLKDIALHTPAYQSIFDNPYLAMWREMRRKYGVKVHFNIYYETRGFNLSQMPDRYRDEWRNNADWIRLSFHARANDPDRPYVHATAERIAEDYKLVNREIERFAGRELMSPTTTIHWGETTAAAVAALRDAGVKTMAGYFELRRDIPAVSYDFPVVTVQHLSGRDYWNDAKRGLLFVRHDAVLNDASMQVVPHLERIAVDPHQAEVMELMIHEQHWYPGWVGHRPDYAQRIDAALRWVTERGYKPVFFEDGFLGAR